MRIFTLLLAAASLVTAAHAQTVATFEDLSLAHPDTFYVNYSAPLSDVGFNDGHAHFPCVYDTAYGGYWSSGFAYSNMTDSVTSGYTNGYSAKAGIGYAGSAKYAVAYGSSNVLRLTGLAIGRPVAGFYITNNTYAYNSMRDGDFVGKKFGGTTGNDPDWFKLVVRGYLHDTLGADSVQFYLADFRFANNDSDYIVRTWQPVNLTALGNVDSLQFTLSSSDNGIYGMNTPAYFCMDDFSTVDVITGVSDAPRMAAKVYPNPANEVLNIDLSGTDLQQLTITSISGAVVYSQSILSAHTQVSTAGLTAGVYLLHLAGNGAGATVRFIKQ